MSNPRCYEIDATNAVASPTKSILGLISATTVRPEIYDYDLGSSAVPADNALQWFFQRFTGVGTSTGVTPSAMDPGDPASLSSAGKIFTGEPTYTANLIVGHFALNQRATHRVNMDQRGPMKCPATANNGIGLYPVHASFTGNVDAVVWFNE